MPAPRVYRCGVCGEPKKGHVCRGAPGRAAAGAKGKGKGKGTAAAAAAAQKRAALKLGALVRIKQGVRWRPETAKIVTVKGGDMFDVDLNMGFGAPRIIPVSMPQIVKWPGK